MGRNDFAVRSETPVFLRIDPMDEFRSLILDGQFARRIWEALEASRPAACYEARGTRMTLLPESGPSSTTHLVRFLPEHQSWIPNHQRDRTEETSSSTDVSSWRRRWLVRRPTLWEAMSYSTQIRVTPHWDAQSGDEVLQMGAHGMSAQRENPYPECTRFFCDELLNLQGETSYLCLIVDEHDGCERRYLTLLSMERDGDQSPSEVETGPRDYFLFIDTLVTPPPLISV